MRHWTNNFFGESDNGTKHVSGDVMIKVSDRHLGGSLNAVDKEDCESMESIQSEASDMSEDMDEVIAPQYNAAYPYGAN